MSWKRSVPDRKFRLLDQRLVHLRGVVKRVEGATHVSKAAEHVRHAALAIIKTKRALITEYPQRDPTGLQLRKLQDEEQRWVTMSTNAIVDEYGIDA